MVVTGEGNGSPLQYSCLEDPMDTGALQAVVQGVSIVRCDLATKPPLPWLYTILAVFSVLYGLTGVLIGIVLNL